MPLAGIFYNNEPIPDSERQAEIGIKEDIQNDGSNIRDNGDHVSGCSKDEAICRSDDMIMEDDGEKNVNFDRTMQQEVIIEPASISIQSESKSCDLLVSDNGIDRSKVSNTQEEPVYNSISNQNYNETSTKQCKDIIPEDFNIHKVVDDDNSTLLVKRNTSEGHEAPHLE